MTGDRSTTAHNEERTGLRDWLRDEDVATLLGVTTTRLRSWRLNGSGPAFVVWNREYVIYNPRSVAYFQRVTSPFARTRRGHPWLEAKFLKV
jgi:hypothetical protein